MLVTLVVVLIPSVAVTAMIVSSTVLKVFTVEIFCLIAFAASVTLEIEKVK